jgi:hypothetical protein
LAGFVEVTSSVALSRPWIDLEDPIQQARLSTSPDPDEIVAAGLDFNAFNIPWVVGAKKGDVSPSTADQHAMVMQAMEAVRDHVETHFDDVGDTFASEARAIHEGRSEQRGIYGQASPKEVKDLVEDGVPVMPMPPKPVEKQKLN